MTFFFFFFLFRTTKVLFLWNRTFFYMKNWHFYSIPYPLITLLKLSFQFLNLVVCWLFFFSIYGNWKPRDAIKITLRCKLKPHKNNFLGRRAFLSGFSIKHTVRGTFELPMVWPWRVLFCHLVSTGEFHSVFSFFDDQLCRHLFLGNLGSLKRTELPLKCQNGENSSRMLWGKTDWRERYFHFHSLGANSGQS